MVWTVIFEVSNVTLCDAPVIPSEPSEGKSSGLNTELVSAGTGAAGDETVNSPNAQSAHTTGRRESIFLGLAIGRIPLCK